MKRDMDIVRLILLALEDAPAEEGEKFVYDERVSGIDDAVLREHIRLVVQEGLAEIELLETLGGDWGVGRASLLSRGHDFVEAVRTPARLKKALAWITETGRAVTVQLVIEWAGRGAAS